MDNDKSLNDWFGSNKYEELELGDRILSGDIFVQDAKVHPATDIGNGIYTSHHFKHYRMVIDHKR